MLHLNMKSVLKIRSEFEKKLDKYSYKIIDKNEFERIYVIEDSLILVATFYDEDCPICINTEEHFSKYKNHMYLEFPKSGKPYYLFYVEEVTPNEIEFKFHNTNFCKELELIFDIDCLKLDVQYIKFKGYTRLYWSPETPTKAEKINAEMPELKLYERYMNWTGTCYNIIVLELSVLNSEKQYAVAYTTNTINNYINSLVKNYISSGEFYAENLRQKRGAVHRTLKSMKNIHRKSRIEENLKYFSFKRFFREKDDVWRYADKIVDKAYKGNYDLVEKTPYYIPKNKWTTEELVYKICKNIFTDNVVIYQHRPFFLRSSIGGQLSYDVFITGLNIAFEYQGKQHFEPVDYFGGQKAFEDVQRRDQEKRILSEENGIKLIYINYWEEVTAELIKNKINDSKQKT